jgi:hypothetical protein
MHCEQVLTAGKGKHSLQAQQRVISARGPEQAGRLRSQLACPSANRPCQNVKDHPPRKNPVQSC